ncbi:arylesterase [Sphingomonas radiodurans]|uniref:arylesterase n=1 Tax=Sphingomonas radiodurans TaxID=2890321 RepID=UPI001E3F7829|nr:arylesterase [Sphingomonas radiodurans]WBH17882.1 arylesterase [Sphingomonas radiodurans]
MAKRHLVVAVALVHLSTACSPATDEQSAATNASSAPAPAPVARATAEAADTKLVVALGDSLYAGYNLGPTEGFAPVLERTLKERGVAAQVVNAGVSGDTSAGGRARVAFVLDGLARKPDLVIVGLGANDMLRGLSPARTRENIEAILAELKRRDIPMMLTGMVAAPNMGADYAGAFNAIYPDLAKKYGAPLYPFFLDGVITDRRLLLGDGIHPNPAGVNRVVSKVAPLVTEALK